MKRTIMIALFTTSVSLSLAQTSPYSGQQAREIKALSDEEIQNYLSGSGMGFAKAAELNHFPGPKHVLELTTLLRLTEGQVLGTKKVFETMNHDAVELGKAIIDEEETLNRRFVHNHIDRQTLAEITGKIAGLQGKLRAVHLAAHLAMKEILTQKQVERYDELRGYGRGSSESSKHKH